MNVIVVVLVFFLQSGSFGVVSAVSTDETCQGDAMILAQDTLKAHANDEDRIVGFGADCPEISEIKLRDAALKVSP